RRWGRPAGTPGPSSLPGRTRCAHGGPGPEEAPTFSPTLFLEPFQREKSAFVVGVANSIWGGLGRDGGFDLSDALPDNENKKPTAIPKKPSAGDDFDLGDAVVDGENDDPRPPNPPKPMPNPNPNHPSSSGSFSDADLADGISGGEGKGGSDGGGSHRKEGEEADAPGVIPGIVGAVVVAVAGAISSFIAYQKKKLCFKEN
uniref:CD99 molecule (Xg blood group) n=1 Tax=Pan troglodytes TaxID=9598 RepID=A0A2I3T327_PANTR